VEKSQRPKAGEERVGKITPPLQGDFTGVKVGKEVQQRRER